MKKKRIIVPAMSPEKYIKTKARQLPLGKTYISRTSANNGVYVIAVTREHKGGKFTVGVYLIDMYCLGVKDSFYYFSITPEEFKDRILSSGINYEETEYVEAHNLIYGALEYAEEAGIEPAREFKVSEFILEPDDDRIPLMEFEFGHNGVRELVVGPDREEMKHIPTLEKNVPGEYIVTGCIDSCFDGSQDYDADYEAITGYDDPRSFNFDFHPFPHNPYPENLESVRHTELLDIFYPTEGNLGITLDETQIAKLRAISRDELLADLRVIAGYELGESEKEIEEDGCYNYNEINVMYVICTILAEIGGSDTKDLVRSILQQSSYWQDAYLGDYGLDIMHSVIANAFEDCPEELAGMVLEQGYSAYSRATMLFSLEWIALWHSPAREIIEREVRDIAELILHGDGSELPLLSDYTMGALSDIIVSLEMKQSLPLVKEMHDRGLINERVYGSYEEQLEELSRIEKSGSYVESRYTTLEQIYKNYK
ncbi:MAG: hypothetical protein K2G52_12540 [Muribaculaceae bacterium]|nr:hypothetical protein [Muribaculaceae bacterium]